MKKHIRFLGVVLLMLFITGLTDAQIHVTLAGKISNVKANTASVKDQSGVVKVITVHDDGSFNESFELSRAGLYSFVYSRESTEIYLSEGFNLNIELNLLYR